MNSLSAAAPSPTTSAVHRTQLRGSALGFRQRVAPWGGDPVPRPALTSPRRSAHKVPLQIRFCILRAILLLN